jgi:hypothetical protein
VCNGGINSCIQTIFSLSKLLLGELNGRLRPG